MAARRRQEEYEEEQEDRASGLELLSKWRRQLAVPLILLSFGAGAWLMWQRYGEQVLAHASYQLDPESIQFTTPPEWLQGDILAEVVRDGSLTAMQIHEPDLTVRVAGAFEQHPWIRRVDRVRKKYPAGLEVELTYRSPVAMVVVKEGLRPIDADGVWVPGLGYITKEHALTYPAIYVGATQPVGPKGAGWGDPVVVDAAKLASVLESDWQTLGPVIYQIELNGTPTLASAAPEFDLVGRPDHPDLLIHWGRAPGKELAGEPNAATKLEKLKELVAESQQQGEGTLRGRVDLRSVRALSAMNRVDPSLQ